MQDKVDKKNLHFLLENRVQRNSYISALGGGSSPVSQKDRHSHGNTLMRQLLQIEAVSPGQIIDQIDNQSNRYNEGILLQVNSFIGEPLKAEALESSKTNIELRNIKKNLESNELTATLFLPNVDITFLKEKISNYTNDVKSNKGRRQFNNDLFNSIQNIGLATFYSLWNDDFRVLPNNVDEKIWWEVWLPVEDDRLYAVDQFLRICELLKIQISSALEFPERTVFHIYCSRNEFESNSNLLNIIAEIRRPKETTHFFSKMSSIDQTEWIKDLSSRLIKSSDTPETPYICLVDGGVNLHPFLKPFLNESDLHTVNEAWGYNDEYGHATGLAGLALIGDFTDHLIHNNSVQINHRIESVKIISQKESNDSKLYGNLVREAIATPEITNPYRKRLYSMAVAAMDGRDRGRPSSWSAALDNAISDNLNNFKNPKLFIVCAGNIEPTQENYSNYPSSNQVNEIHDPAQAWNALTVGACTHKTTIDEVGTEFCTPVAKSGSLSPYSSTSLVWMNTQWPYKPDVVFEGGNISHDSKFGTFFDTESLSLLTLNHEPHIGKNFTITSQTSAASALCAKMAAEIMGHYPNYWPETIRALIVHSAEWTENMKKDFLGDDGKKSDYVKLLHHCGYGEPNLNKALWSASNSLSLVCQESLKPLKKNGSKIDFNQINIHDLPWPKDELLQLGHTPVKMRVTLSHFIEGNPGACDASFSGSRYQYESLGLRFEIRRPAESTPDFLKRINKNEREKGVKFESTSTDSDWLIGPKNRVRGSIHSDIWIGTAADLANRGMLAVFPVTGWWKNSINRERYNIPIRYSLIVTITTPDSEIDLYTVVQNQILNESSIKV